MTDKAKADQNDFDEELDFVTFYLGDLLLGINIHTVQEINRQLDLTIVPHAPDYVRGTVNLRGEVVTVIDLRVVLNSHRTEIADGSRNIVVNSGGEQIGLLVDRIADVVKTVAGDIEPAPINVSGIDGRFFKGVYQMESELLVILDVEEARAVDASTLSNV